MLIYRRWWEYCTRRCRKKERHSMTVRGWHVFMMFLLLLYKYIFLVPPLSLSLSLFCYNNIDAFVLEWLMFHASRAQCYDLNEIAHCIYTLLNSKTHKNFVASFDVNINLIPKTLSKAYQMQVFRVFHSLLRKILTHLCKPSLHCLNFSISQNTLWI